MHNHYKIYSSYTTVSGLGFPSSTRFQVLDTSRGLMGHKGIYDVGTVWG